MESFLNDLSILSEALPVSASASRLTPHQQPLSSRFNRMSSSNKSVFEVLRSEKQFSMLCDILEKNRGLGDEFDGEAHFTLFAPTNAAFARLHELVGGGSSGGGKMRRWGASGGDEGEDDDEDELYAAAGRRIQLPDMASVIRYHMVPAQQKGSSSSTGSGSLIETRNLFDGMLLESDLKEKLLNNRNQRIKVCKIMGAWKLNWFSHILTHQDSADIRAKNGLIHAIDFPLIPPCETYDVLFKMPFIFSTFTSAINHLGLERLISTSALQTVLVPSNCAWKLMNPTDLLYLFSRAGHSDLQKVMEYHVLEKLEYYSCITRASTAANGVTVPTRLKGERVLLQAIPKSGKDLRRSNDFMDEEGEEGGDRQRQHQQHPDDFIFVINKGEATIKIHDWLTKSGNMHVINSVLIPKSVCLPSQRSDSQQGRNNKNNRRSRDIDIEYGRLF